MKLDYLREFAAAAKSGEFQKAAKELGVSPSVLSKHIKALEQELELPLFTRARKPALTIYGEILLPYAEQLAALQREYLAEFSGAGTDPAEHLVIGLSSIQYREQTGQFLERFTAAYPNAGISMRASPPEQLAGLVLNGQCNVAFIRSVQSLERDPGLIYFPFCIDGMVAFLPREHRLAKARSVNLRDLNGETVFLRTKDSITYRIFTGECKRIGISPNIKFVSSYGIYDMIRRGEGITLYLAPPSDPHEGQLAVIPISPPIYTFVDIAARRDGLTPPVRRFFRYAFEHTFRANGPDAVQDAVSLPDSPV